MAEEKNFNERYYEHYHRKVRVAPFLGRVGRHGTERSRTERALEERQRDEVQSFIAEAINGRIKTEYSFEAANGKLVAADGEYFEDMFARSLDGANELADLDDFYENFLPLRAKYEFDELHEQELIINNSINGNTLITFSPYTEESYDPQKPESTKKLIRAHQKPYLRRAMVRMFYFDGSKAHILSRSIDDSNVEMLQKAAEASSLKYTFNAVTSTEMLGERILTTYSSRDEAKEALDRIVVIAEALSTASMRKFDAQKLVESQPAVIDKLLAEARRMARFAPDYGSYSDAWEKVLYNAVALIESVACGHKIDTGNIDGDMSVAGAQARKESRPYDGCGYVLDGKSQMLQKLGYSSLESKKSESRCPFCNSKATGTCLDMQCTNVKQCGSELKGGKVIRQRGKKIKEVSWADAFISYWKNL